MRVQRLHCYADISSTILIHRVGMLAQGTAEAYVHRMSILCMCKLNFDLVVVPDRYLKT